MPNLGIKMDAIPGRLNEVFAILNSPGIFYGQCSELCGLEHAFMPFMIQGISLDE
jgi:heme/copper-type cytochrome/quinol oxidase subunit 2